MFERNERETSYDLSFFFTPFSEFHDPLAREHVLYGPTIRVYTLGPAAALSYSRVYPFSARTHNVTILCTPFEFIYK